MNKKAFRIFVVICLLALINYSPYNTEGTEPSISEMPASECRVINMFSDHPIYSYLDHTITSFMRKWDLKGATVAIAINGKMVFAKGYGYMYGDRGPRIQPYNRLRIASVSKLVTATAIMKLAEDQKLDLNDRVFGPEGILNDSYFSNPRDKRSYDITVAHLLSHEGGWTTRWGDQMFMPYVVASSLKTNTPVSTSQIVRFALDKRLHFTPGRGRSYSNLGYAILGLVVEKVSGESYYEYCQKNIFEPLAIYDFAPAKNLFKDRDPYEVEYFEPSNAVQKESIYNPKKMVPASYGGNDIEALGGAGGWITTAPDLLKFVLAVDGKDYNPDILSASSIDYMTRFGNGASPVGWKATTSNGYWWRTGSFPGTSALVRRQPDGIAWVIIFNTNTWKQSMFPTDISGMMARAIRGTKEWIDDDLFNYQLPVSLSSGYYNIFLYVLYSKCKYCKRGT